MRLLAHIISAIFQPLLMPSLVFYTALYHIDNSTNLTEAGQWTVLSLIFLTTCIIPILVILMFRFAKVIKDLQMTDRKDRFFPFIFISIFYVIVAVLFHRQLPLNPLLSISLIAITVVVVLTNIITFFWKISAHSAGVVGWLGFIMVYEQVNPGTNTLLAPLLGAIVLCGIVLWARLYLNAHKPIEILGGSVLGFLICYGSIYFFL